MHHWLFSLHETTPPSTERLFDVVLYPTLVIATRNATCTCCIVLGVCAWHVFFGGQDNSGASNINRRQATLGVQHTMKHIFSVGCRIDCVWRNNACARCLQSRLFSTPPPREQAAALVVAAARIAPGRRERGLQTMRWVKLLLTLSALFVVALVVVALVGFAGGWRCGRLVLVLVLSCRRRVVFVLRSFCHQAFPVCGPPSCLPSHVPRRRHHIALGPSSENRRAGRSNHVSAHPFSPRRKPCQRTAS